MGRPRKNFKDPNRKSNRFKGIEMPENKVVAERYKIYDAEKAKGRSDIAALVKALEVIPTITKPATRRKK